MTAENFGSQGAHPESSVIDSGFQRQYEQRRAVLERLLQDRLANLARKRTAAQERAQSYQARTGSPVPSGWIESYTATAENSVRQTEAMLAFLRPSSEADTREREAVLDMLPKRIEAATHPTLPLRFHGTSLDATRGIFAARSLLSSVDRIGTETSMDTAGQISVTDPRDFDVTVSGYTDLNAEGYCLPAGCIFVLLPASRGDEEAGHHLTMGNVDFGANPRQLFGVMTSRENVERVQGWAQDAGIDAGVVMEFFDFADHLDELKRQIESGSRSAQDFVSYPLSP